MSVSVHNSYPLLSSILILPFSEFDIRFYDSRPLLPDKLHFCYFIYICIFKSFIINIS